MQFDILSLGSLTRELLVWAERFPGAGDGIRAPSLWTSGGMAGNLAQAVARLGGQAAMISAVGYDPLGDQVVAELAESGVNIDFVLRCKGKPTPLVILIVNPAKERAGLVLDEGTQTSLSSREIPDELLRSTRVFFTDSALPETSIAVCQRAKELGIPVAFDLQMSRKHSNVAGIDVYNTRLFELCDYYFSDQENFLAWRDLPDFEEAVQAALKDRPSVTLVITDGLRGSQIITRERWVRIPAFPVEMVDSIGAGDAYHGAFLYTHIALGWELERAGIFASAAAALSCLQPGARNGLPTMQQVQEFLKERT